VKSYNQLRYLKWDSQLFGFPIGRIHANNMSASILERRLQDTQKKKIKFVELFCDVSDLVSIESSEKLGFSLADVRVNLMKTIDSSIEDTHAGLNGQILKKATPKDLDNLIRIGNGLFSASRYYQYPNFDFEKVDLMYQKWIGNAILGQYDDELYYIDNQSDILAFCSLRYNQREAMATIGLFGVNNQYQGQGLGSQLLDLVFLKSHKFGIEKIEIITQGKNTEALHLYQKNGFVLKKITLCFYNWLK
jgi:RimJ/RimL family protein N-acetyltransferase